MKINDEVQEEAQEIAKRTRVVPVTMIVLVLIALSVGTGLVFLVNEDSDEGTLGDPQGIVEGESAGGP